MIAGWPVSLPLELSNDLKNSPLARARTKPGRMTFARSGTGSSPHLAGELLQHIASVDSTHVSFRGGAASGTEIIARRFDLRNDNVPRLGTRTQPTCARRWKPYGEWGAVERAVGLKPE